MTPTQTKRRLGLLSLVVSAGLMAIKFYAYRLTRSQVVLTDALESIINVFTSGFALYSLHLASLPKDENHPYGHGKIEYLSVGFEGALIFIAGAFIFYSATLGLLHPHPVGRLDWGVLLLAGTAAVNLAVGLLLVRTGRRLNSVALTGDGQHLYLDALTSIVSVAALGLVAATGVLRFDAGAALLLGGFILVNGGRMLRRSVSGLMDETDTAIVAEVIDELQARRRAPWIDVHNLRVQRYGANRTSTATCRCPTTSPWSRCTPNCTTSRSSSAPGLRWRSKCSSTPTRARSPPARFASWPTARCASTPSGTKSSGTCATP